MSIIRDTNGRNLVVSKIWEVASMRFGDDRVIIRQVRRKEIVPDKKYQWSLYERETDTAPSETVSLEVSLSETLLIDDEVSIDLESVRRSESRSI